jgi:hypothetical protein
MRRNTLRGGGLDFVKIRVGLVMLPFWNVTGRLREGGLHSNIIATAIKIINTW